MTNLFDRIPKEEQQYYCVQILIGEAEPISQEVTERSKLLMKRVMRSSDLMSEGLRETNVMRYISREVNFNGK